MICAPAHLKFEIKDNCKKNKKKLGAYKNVFLKNLFDHVYIYGQNRDVCRLDLIYFKRKVIRSNYFSFDL